MIYTVLLLSLYMAETSTALKLSSPVHIIRPIDDVHANCNQDVESICNNINTDSNNKLMSDTTANDHLQKYLDLEKNTDETWQSMTPARRLSEIGSDAVVLQKSRSYSIKVGLRVVPKGSKDLADDAQRAKDHQRFLNYGRENDTCLWNAFDAKRVSSQCASSLQRVNEILDYPTMKYSGESEYVKRTSITITIPLVSVLIILLGCVMLREVWREEEEEDDDTESSDDDDEVDGNYHILDESELIAHIAVPLKVI